MTVSQTTNCLREWPRQYAHFLADLGSAIAAAT
jgi:hypothetical protein